MAITNKQRVAMGAIVAIGLAGGVAVLMTERHAPPGQEAHEHHDEHGHGQKDHAEGTPAGQAAAGKSSHADQDEHEHADEERHAHEGKDGIPRAGSAPAGIEAAGRKEADRGVRLSDEQAKASGITVAPAGPGTLQAANEFQGEVHFNEDRTAHVVPRLAGVAEAVQVNLGQQVRKGQVLAVIASTELSEQRSELLSAQRRRDAARAKHEREKKLWEDKISAEQDYLEARTALQEADIAVQNAMQKLSAVGAPASAKGLNRFEVRAPFDGTVVEKHLTLGEAVKDDASIFTVSDLSSVWAEFAVSPKDLGVVRVGQRAVVSTTAFPSKAEGTISYVGALLGEQTRTARARVTLANPQGAWRPGLFVTVSVLGGNQQIPIAVPGDAVQSVGNQPMVFKAVPGGFLATPVQVGRSDGNVVEILGGLQRGENVAVANTFVLKSELGKKSAEHTH